MCNCRRINESHIGKINHDYHFKDMDVPTNDYINYISLSVFDDCFKMFVDDKS